jgi:uncharacterized protein (TIGR03118 family)
MHPISRQFALIASVLVPVAGSAQAGDIYVQTNLVSNGTVPGTVTDPNLVGAWGMSYSTKSPIWVSDQAADVSGSGAATVYSVSDGLIPSAAGPLLTVPVPNQNNAPPNPNMTNGPTGQVSTGAQGISTLSTDFQVGGGKAAFIFANLDGSISAWKGGLAAAQITASVSGASFTGLAIGNLPNGGAAQIYAADQNSGNIYIFNSKWQVTGTFTDPNFSKFPPGYAAFNVQNILVNGVQTIFVTYANQSTGGGIIDEFKTDGTFIKTLVSDTTGVNLAAPWGLTVAPANWGPLGGDLLVGNNNANAAGLTEINAYNLSNGNFAGALTLNSGQPFSATELWAIGFGNGASAGSADTLLFVSGGEGNTNGLIGAISTPEPSSAVLGLIAFAAVAAVRQWKSRGRRVMA